jgi:hypothetical protein
VEELLRKNLAQKVASMRKLGEEVRRTAAIPAVESFMRFADLYCSLALWHLGEQDFSEYEVKYDD